MQPGETEGGVQANALDRRLARGINDQEPVGVEAAVLGNDDAFVFTLDEIKNQIFGRNGVAKRG